MPTPKLKIYCFFVVAVWLSGCATPTNPSLPASVGASRDVLDRLAEQPVPLDRPLVVLGGYMDPGFNRARMDKALGRVFDDERMVGVAFPFLNNFDDCRAKVLEKVQAAFPSDDPAATVEVDVVAYSMGGLIARYCALPVAEGETPRRVLRIRRLFTIATPHRGANLSAMPHYDPVVRDMRSGSQFLNALDAHLPNAPYRLYPYVRLGDNVVGPANAAPPGYEAWWVANRPLSGAHLHAHRDPRIVADIALRLRGQTPLTTDPPAPLPR